MNNGPLCPRGDTFRPWPSPKSCHHLGAEPTSFSKRCQAASGSSNMKQQVSQLLGTASDFLGEVSTVAGYTSLGLALASAGVVDAPATATGAAAFGYIAFGADTLKLAQTS